MAVSLAGSKQYTLSVNSTSLATSMTIPAGDNRLLVVGIALNYAAQTSATVSSVTANGTALTKTDGNDDENMTAGTAARVELWKLVAPPTGTVTIAVNFTGATRAYLVASAWTGVSQTTPLGEVTTATGSDSAPTVTVVSATDEIVVDVVSAMANATNASPDLTAVSGTVFAADAQYASFGGVASRGGASYETGAASTVVTWTTAASTTWSIAGVPIKPETSGGGGTTPPTPPSGATLGVGIAEVSIVPRRAAPNMSPSSATGTIGLIENQQADWEASGMYPKVLQGTLIGDQIIWDDVYTIPSVAPAGAISISALPTQNSPTASLIVATQDTVVQYPLPVSGSPTTTAYPQLPLAATTTAEAQAPENLLPVFYPSAYDAGGRLLELVAVQCVGQNFTDGTDAWAISVRPDDTEPWSTAQRQKQAEAMFFMESGNFGRVWRIAAQILDGDQDDPIGPSGSQIIGWFREIDADPGVYSQRARAIPEVS